MKNNITKIRKDRGLSQRKLSKLLGVDAGQVSRLENGQTKLHSEWIRKLIPILKCTASELLGEQPMEDNETINMSEPMSKVTIEEIMIQIHLIYPDESYDGIVALVGKVYDELKDDLDIDPAYVRGFLRSSDLSNLL